MNKYTIVILVIIILVLGIYFITRNNSKDLEEQVLVTDNVNYTVEEQENGNYIIYDKNNPENQKEIRAGEESIYMIDPDYNPDPTGEYTPSTNENENTTIESNIDN